MNSKKHIVFVIGYYFPEAGSTSLCAIRVLNDLNKRNDVEISCVCGTSGTESCESVNEIKVYKIHHITYTDRIDKSTNIVRKAITKNMKTINDMINLHNYPDMDKRYSKRIFKTLESIEANKHIDCIVSVYMPKQSISASMMFKKRHPDVRCIAYFLDTLRSNKPRFIPFKYHNQRIDSFENSVFDLFDRTILMEYGTDYYSKDICSMYKKKISYLGFPSLEFLKLDTKSKPGKQCCFVGTTYSEIRNPLFAMKVFEAAHIKDDRISFRIYGPSNMKNDLIAWQDKHSDSFSYHDFISHERIESVYDEADYIVNIGNTIKGVVPGKTFELFGTLKPIIHFTDITNDSSLRFIKEYPNACIISYDMSIDVAVDCLLDYLNKPYSMCSKSLVERTFSFASPAAVSKLIYETIK